ncbi:MAG: TonB-dependent receptor [Sphingobacterium sp.]|uniref:TonB-dependent receptor n=1 Tax=Sphingobacterium sp. JB170 TaxID=1434842 RepID=UPI00097E9A98|nr:TonB-dependent receptor [Sphingobacterium sp. JB170]SJN41349.1 TonB-dependent receptor [Sphingobacterium sp. JB170]
MRSKVVITQLLFLFSSILLVHAQDQKPIQGTIQDTYGTPIVGAHVTIKETGEGTVSNNKGFFQLKVPNFSEIHLVCSHIGYESAEQTINLSKTNLDNLLFVLIENNTTLSEVIITAEKKETKLQKTPIAVSAISSKELEQRKMTEMTDLVMNVPNLITMTGGSPSLNIMSIRGILTFSADPAIGVYIDGVPMFDGYAASMQLQDINRVEVLRGPQSTLYGRNALGGVVNILTKEPGNITKGFAEVGMGNYNTQEYRAGISTPLIKNKLFASVNGFYTGRKGLYTNEYDGKDYDNYKNYGGNFYLKYLATDRLSLILNSKLEKNDLHGTFPYAVNVDYAFEKPYTVNQNGKNVENRTLSTTSLQAKYQLDKWEISSLTGFNYLNDTYDDYDQDFSAYDFLSYIVPDRPQKTWTQEFKFVSRNLGRWDITGGLFGFVENRKSNSQYYYGPDAVSTYPDAPYLYSSISNLNGKGFAAYAHVTYALTERLKLTGGLRYDYDEKKLNIHDEYEKEPNPVQVFPERIVNTSANAVSPKLNLSYLATDDITLYANYAKGFRPGGVNQYGSSTSTRLTYKPEYTDNYEIGVKTEWLNRRLRANFTGFYTHWKDQQQTIMAPEMYIDNIGVMSSKGIELEVTALPFKNIEVHYNLGVVTTKYDKLILLGDDGMTNVDYKGNKQIFTPDFSSALSVTYSGKINKNVGFYIVPEWKYLGKQYMTYYNDLVQDPFHLLNINAGIKFKNYELKLWAKNLTDSRYISFVYANQRGNNSPVNLGLPTTFGASAKVNF